jgi:MATE family multidrug resistance protein
MNAVSTASAPGTGIPAQRIDAQGRAHVDWHAIARLTLPLMANSSLQAVISLTDTWFVGQISTQAVAGMGSIYWFAFFLHPARRAVSGSRCRRSSRRRKAGGRRTRASRATWIALWGTLAMFPFFVGLAYLGRYMLMPFGLGAEVEQQALAFWQPRMFGAPLGVALWAGARLLQRHFAHARDASDRRRSSRS